MKKDYMLYSKKAKKLYSKVKDLPIIDYHCHLSPQMIFEDKPFDNIGEIWLGGDHYKWRLMRTVRIPEEMITGKETSWHDKFIAYASALEMSPENPLYHWSHMELSLYFGIDTPLKSSTAEMIWEKANAYIKSTAMSPRKLIAKAKVEGICTTDDVIDSLEWHKKIAEDKSFSVKVLPSFRVDNLLLTMKDTYPEYLEKLSSTSGVEINDLESFKKAVENRLDFFVEMGCKVTDTGLVYFPNYVATDKKADKTFEKILKREKVTEEEYIGFIGNMYLFLGKLYKERNLVMQWHLASDRNINTKLYKHLGLDCGVDCVGNAVDGPSLFKMLDAINENSGLPKTIVYTLNPSNAEQIGTITSAFPNVCCGAAWWFCDHRRGIEHEIQVICENSSLGSFYGMLTDSRSFLSYARHDYFRRILCNMVGKWVENGEYDAESAEKLVQKVSFGNVKEMIG